MTRRPEDHQGAGTPAAGDVADGPSLHRLLDGDALSRHLRSRREVERLAGEGMLR